MEDFPSELNHENLEEFLADDSAFVDYFNTFLSLSCFPERIFYNKELDLLEQFSQKLVKDEHDNIQIIPRPLKHPVQRTKHDPTFATVHIGYCVTILDRKRGFEWLKEYRLPEFLKSNLYAEYKLSKVLSTAQSLYIDAIKDDVFRAKECDIKCLTKGLEQSIKSPMKIEIANQCRNPCEKRNESIRVVPWTRGEIPKSGIITTTFDKGNNFFITCEEKQNRVSAPSFKTSDTEDVLSVGELSDGSDDLDGKLNGIELREDATKKTSDAASHDDRLTDVALNDAIGKDLVTSGVTSSDVMNSDVMSSNVMNSGIMRCGVMSSDVTSSDVTSSDVTSSDVTSSDVASSDVTSSDVTSSDVVMCDVTSGDVTTVSDIFYDNIANGHVRRSDVKDDHVNESDDIVSDEVADVMENDESEDMNTEEFPRKNLRGFAKNDPDSIETSSLNTIPNDLLLASDCRLGVEVKNVNYQKPSPEIESRGLVTNESSKEIIAHANEGTPECVQSEALDNVHENVVVNKEATSTPQGTHETTSTRDLSHKNAEYCRCFRHQDNQMSTAGKLEVARTDAFFSNEDQSESLKFDTAEETEENARFDYETYDMHLEGGKDEKSILKEESFVREPKHDYEREKTMDHKDTSSGVVAGTGCNTEGVDFQMEKEQDSLPEKFEVMSKQSSTLDVRLSDLDEVAYGIHKLGGSDSESEGRVSVEEEAEGTTKPGVEDERFDLVTKQGMDKLKEFLAGTKGETLFSFWLQVELWKSVQGEGERTKVIQEMKEMFLRNGSPLELPNAMKRHAKILAEDLDEAQRIIAHPLLTYWCPRFILHQLKTPTTATLKHQMVASVSSQPVTELERSDVVSKPDHLNTPHFNTSPRLVRPHSSTPRVAEAKARRTHVRSKSAFPRIITTPCHTNAGKKQLELYATSPPAQYGYKKRQVECFPPPSDQDYLSSIRLVINPLAKPSAGLRSAWSQRSEEKRQSNPLRPAESPNMLFHSEGLVDALMYNSETGCFFKEFVNKQKNKLWLNCLSFWHALMEYTAYFDGDTLNPVLVAKKAQCIYARFIAAGSLCDIQLGWKRQAEVRQKLEPGYEDLFDVVEEHVLACLKEPWESLCRNERREYDMVPKKETVRYLEVDLKKTRDRRKSLGDVSELESDEEGKRDRGKYSVEEANHPLSIPKDGVSFESIIKDGAQLEGFQKFLERKDPKGVMDLMAWTDMETFQRIPRTMQDKRNKKAKEIRNGYLNSKFFFGPDSPATKEAQNLILSMNGSSRIKERPSTSLVNECQKYVRCRIERRWLALYKESQEYIDRQNPRNNISEVVEDIMLRRRLQRSEAAWRVLNSRWVSSSRDIVALRQTLNNPESCLAFRKFVALKGDTYENDVLFWIEVQKYKDLCHRHASEKCTKKKIQAITDCFLTSSIPPELQIDVPIEMAEKLMEKITSRNANIGPYLFREVQMTVFRVMFNMWKEFCSFRSTIKDGGLLEVLDKKLQQHRIEVRQRREASERKKLARQEAERKRKEKEEKERRELKSVEQLVSLMTESHSWEHEEEDVVLWRYSKHVTGYETVKIINASAQEETSSLVALTNRQSLVTKRSNNIASRKNAGKDYLAVSESSKLPVKSRGSAITDSLYSNQSKGTQKTRKSSSLLIPKIKHIRSKVKANEGTGERGTGVSRDNEVEQSATVTSLKNTRRKKGTGTETLNFAPKERWVKGTRVRDIGDKAPSLEITGDKDSGFEAVGVKKNLMVLPKRKGGATTNTRVMSFGRESQGRNRSPVALTSELLKDFTNSPEGAPLETPLSLVRINESQRINRSFLRESKQKTLTQVANKNGLRYERDMARKDIQDFVPDVIVN